MLETEFTGRVRIEQIIAIVVDDKELSAALRQRAKPIKDRLHIDIDHEDSKRLAARVVDRRRDAQGRKMRDSDRAAFRPQVDLRHIDIAGRQRDRLGEIVAIASRLQFGIGNDAHRAARAVTIHPHDLAPTIVDTDDAELAIRRFGGELRGIAARHAFAPGGFGGAAQRIASTGKARAHDAFKRHRRPEAEHVGARAACVRFEFSRQKPRVRFDALKCAWKDCLFQIPISQYSH